MKQFSTELQKMIDRLEQEDRESQDSSDQMDQT
jgi:hypothetical protein